MDRPEGGGTGKSTKGKSVLNSVERAPKRNPSNSKRNPSKVSVSHHRSVVQQPLPPSVVNTPARHREHVLQHCQPNQVAARWGIVHALFFDAKLSLNLASAKPPRTWICAGEFSTPPIHTNMLLKLTREREHGIR